MEMAETLKSTCGDQKAGVQSEVRLLRAGHEGIFGSGGTPPPFLNIGTRLG
jgi:hypothetical protein